VFVTIPHDLYGPDCTNIRKQPEELNTEAGASQVNWWLTIPLFSNQSEDL